MVRTFIRLPVLLCLLSPVTMSAPAGGDVLILTISDPARRWMSDYIPLVPAIHPPTTHDREDLIQVWLKVPFYLSDDTPRLSRYAPLAHEHVYRPTGGKPHSPLVGWAWRRGDTDAPRRATELLVAHARSADAPLDD